MNIVGVKKHIDKLYKDIFKTVKKEFLSVVNHIYEEIFNEAISLGFDGDLRDLDEAWIKEFFDEYNPVTKYVFSNEIDRKQSYLFEALVSAPMLKNQSYAKAEKYLLRQIKQSGIDLEDAIAQTVYRDLGVSKVKWVAEHDFRTCGDCKELDGEIFDLDKVPDKQHINCRCYLIPVKE